MTLSTHYLQYKMPNAQSVNHDLGTRMQALALAEHGIAVKIVEAVTQLSNQTIYRLKKQARERGFDPEKSTQLQLKYMIDKPRSGRPILVTPGVEQAILETVRKDRNGREKTSAQIGYEHQLSSATILRVLKRNGFRSCKTTNKPCLTLAMKKARLNFCFKISALDY